MKIIGSCEGARFCLYGKGETRRDAEEAMLLYAEALIGCSIDTRSLALEDVDRLFIRVSDDQVVALIRVDTATRAIVLTWAELLAERPKVAERLGALGVGASLALAPGEAEREGVSDAE